MRMECKTIFRFVNNPNVDALYELMDLDTNIPMVVEPMWVVSAVKDGIIQLEGAEVKCGKVVFTNYKDYGFGLVKSDTGISMLEYRVKEGIKRTSLNDNVDFLLLPGFCSLEDVGSNIKMLETCVREVSEHPLLDTAFSFHSRESTHRIVDGMLTITYNLGVLFELEPCVFHIDVSLREVSPDVHVKCSFKGQNGLNRTTLRDCLVYTVDDLKSIVFEVVNETVLKVTQRV